MKVKIYPLNEMISETQISASPFCLHLQIICSSLAKGTSIIKNIIDSNDIDTTIAWCKGIGATIKRSGDKLIIKGVNNNLSRSQALFYCGKNALTAKLMLPILSTVSRPFGIKGNEEILDEIESLTEFFDTYGVNHYRENEMVRFENTMRKGVMEFDGDIDIYLSAGILMALPLLKGQSMFKLRAPVRCEKSYELILKILKSYKIDLKHPSSMRYETTGNQKYKACRITTEIDNFYLSFLSLLTQKLPEEKGLKITNYRSNKSSNEHKLFEFVCNNVATYTRIYPSKTLKKRKFQFNKVEYNVENALPFYMILGTINNQDTIITKVDFSNYRNKRQLKIIENVFNKLDLPYYCYANEIVVKPKKVSAKKQVDCKKDPYVAIAISFLALLSDYPIIIKNADCVLNIYKDFYKNLKEYGATVEFIHDN